MVSPSNHALRINHELPHILRQVQDEWLGRAWPSRVSRFYRNLVSAGPAAPYLTMGMNRLMTIVKNDEPNKTAPITNRVIEGPTNPSVN